MEEIVVRQIAVLRGLARYTGDETRRHNVLI